MPRGNDIRIRSGTTTPSAADFNVGEPAWDKVSGKLYVKNAAGSMVEIGAGGGGGGGVVFAATAGAFPVTGSGSVLYCSTEYGRLYRWDTDNSVYVEVAAWVPSDPRWSLLLPPAPTGVTAVAGNGQATVSWTAPTVSAQTPITDYIVQFSSNGGSTWTTFSDAASTATSAVVSSLTNGTSYVFRVAAVNGVGQGAWSAASAAVSPGSDASFASVSLLLHGNGNLLDSSANSVPVTASGSISASSVQSKWGGGSIACSGGYLSVPAGIAPSGTGDFTVEAWVYPTAWADASRIILQTGTNGLQISSYNNTAWGIARANVIWLINDATPPTLNAWSHIAVVRQSGVLKIYLNGTQTGSTYTGSVDFASLVGTIGGSAEGAPWSGYIDDFRITTAARYTGTFTPPSGEFADYASLIAPGAPTALTATAGDQSVALAWSLPTPNGGPAITDYVVQYSTDGNSWTTFSDGVSTSRSATVTSLTNGTQYSFRVAAVNAVGTGSYSSTATATPAVAATLTITQQPLNNYSATSSDSASFSVTATLSGGTISYQWQAYAYDGNYELNWQNIPGATSSTFSVTPAGWYTATGMPIDYINDVRLRCVVTGTNNAGSLTSGEARWVLFANVNEYVDAYGEFGTYASGTATVGGKTFTTLSMQSGESLILYAEDYYSAIDTSWYSSNAYTVKVQSSSNGTTWSDAYTPVNLRSAFSVNQAVTPQTGTVYYRVLLILNWPFTTTNGSSSSAKGAGEKVIGGCVATWS